MDEHISDGALVAYSLDEPLDGGVAGVEEHLLVCDFCRARLVGIEPFNLRPLHRRWAGPFEGHSANDGQGDGAALGKVLRWW